MKSGWNRATAAVLYRNVFFFILNNLSLIFFIPSSLWEAVELYIFYVIHPFVCSSIFYRPHYIPKKPYKILFHNPKNPSKVSKDLLKWNSYFLKLVSRYFRPFSLMKLDIVQSITTEIGFRPIFTWKVIWYNFANTSKVKIDWKACFSNVLQFQRVTLHCGPFLSSNFYISCL